MSAEITAISDTVTVLHTKMTSTQKVNEAVSACRRQADMQLILYALQDLETRIIALEP